MAPMVIGGWRARGVALALALAGLAPACVPVTVNVNFPQEKLDRAAGSIEDLVRGPEGQATPPAPPPPPAPAPAPGAAPATKPRSAVPSWPAGLGPRAAEAQVRTQEVQVSQNLRFDTPEIQGAIARRQGRARQVEQLAAKGCVGESVQWTLEARPGQGCGPEVGGIVGAENADRQALLAALMKHNSIPASDAGRVRASFVKASRDRAPAGSWVQQDNGQWAKK
jgi:uncharacterized protein YdbL (DUF1318 family)